MSEVQADRLRGAAPAGTLLAVILADLLGGRGFVLSGLAVAAPLIAASLVGPRSTAAYAGAALATTGLLGIWEDVYTTDAGGGRNAQLVRLAGVFLGGVLAVWISRRRIRRGHRLASALRVAEVAQVSALKVAEVAQRTILPAAPPPVPGLAAASRYQSASADALVGGDLYEMVASPWGARLLIGDARGKGLDAVRLAARVLGCFRTLAFRTPDVAELVAALDAEVRQARGSDEDFVTALVVQIGPDGAAGIRVSNAGHPDPLLVTDGTVTPLEPTRRSLPLGLGAAAAGYRFDLPVGGRLLLYTDGLIEARRSADRQFFPYLDAVGAALRSGPLPEALDALLAAANQWSGGIGDDVALLAVERSA